MRMWIAGLIAVTLAMPVRAETPGHLLTEAAGIAQALDDAGERRDALSLIVQVYGARGDLSAAGQIVLAEPEAAVRTALWVALIDGVLEGPGAAVALEVLAEVPDDDARLTALGRVVLAQIDGDDLEGAAATLAQVDEPILADVLGPALVQGWLRRGGEAAARALMADMQSRWARDHALILLARYLADAGQADAALDELSALSNPGTDLALVERVRSLHMAGRENEADALSASVDNPYVEAQIANEIARVALAAGDDAAARDLLANLSAVASWRADWDMVALPLAREQGITAARAWLDAQEPYPGSDVILANMAQRAAAEGDLALARDLAIAAEGAWNADNAWIAIVTASAGTDPSAAMEDLSRLTGAARDTAILAFLRQRPDPTLAQEVLDSVRAMDLPQMRALRLAQLARVV